MRVPGGRRNPELGPKVLAVACSQRRSADAIHLLDGRKYLIQLEAGELSRARGGPRCMTMPLARG